MHHGKQVQLLLMSIILSLSGCVRNDAMHNISEENLKRYDEARLAYRQGRFGTAAELLDSLSTVKGLINQAHFLLAKTRFMQERNQEAEILLTKLLKAVSEHGDARLWLARIKIALNKPAEAEKILIQSLQWNGENLGINSLMGDCQRILGKPDKALNYYRRAALFEDELIKVYLSMAAIYSHHNLIDMEKHYVEKATSLVSEDSVFSEAVELAGME